VILNLVTHAMLAYYLVSFNKYPVCATLLRSIAASCTATEHRHGDYYSR